MPEIDAVYGAAKVPAQALSRRTWTKTFTSGPP
jgi:hypothetical protein